MLDLLNKLFNDKIELTFENIKWLKKDILELFNKIEKESDIDWAKVIRNKLELISEKKDIEHESALLIESLLDEMNVIISDSESKFKVKLFDITKEIDKDYISCNKKRLKKWYKKFCVKQSKIDYEKELIVLQLELLKLQNHIKETWEKVLIIFEWRDAAGKWGTIKRFMEHLNPRWTKVVALPKPDTLEKTQWYFQRYVEHLPQGWWITLFDRSYYNRAWVEPVMWFCTKQEYKNFLYEVPQIENMLVNSWIKIIKLYFSVSKEIQAKRFEARKTNPLKQYKLSPIDQYSQQLWDKYTLAEYKNFKSTDSEYAPWTIINSDNKKKARINAIKYVLNQFDYKDKIDENKLKTDKNIVLTWKQKIEELEDEVDKNINLFK